MSAPIFTFDIVYMRGCYKLMFKGPVEVTPRVSGVSDIDTWWGTSSRQICNLSGGRDCKASAPFGPKYRGDLARFHGVGRWSDFWCRGLPLLRREDCRFLRQSSCSLVSYVVASLEYGRLKNTRLHMETSRALPQDNMVGVSGCVRAGEGEGRQEGVVGGMVG